VTESDNRPAASGRLTRMASTSESLVTSRALSSGPS
jgi:hypothetical protein